MKNKITKLFSLFLFIFILNSISQAEASDNLIKNGNFEKLSGNQPASWTVNANGRGIIQTSSSIHAGGNNSIEIAPNESNTPGPERPGIVQVVQVPSDLKGKSLKLSGYLAGRDGARAAVIIAGLAKDGKEINKVVWYSKGNNWTRNEGTLKVPSDGSMKTIAVICVAEGTEGSAYIDELSIQDAEGAILASTTANLAPVDNSKKASESQEVMPVKNLVINGDFEKAVGAGQPASWNIGAADRGAVRVSSSMRVGGNKSIEILPNELNIPGPNRPGVVQSVPVPGNLKGKTLKLAGYLAGRGGAKAAVLIVGLSKDGKEISKVLWYSKGDNWTRNEGVLNVPSDGSMKNIAVICIAEGTEGSAYIDEVSIQEGTGAMPIPIAATPIPAGTSSQARESQEFVVTQQLNPSAAQININASEIIRTIPETLFGANVEWSYGGNGVWNEQENRLNDDLLQTAKDAGVTMIRFPGGGHSDYYHWADKVGPMSSRVAVPTLLGGPAIFPSFATNEYLEFIDALKAESLITVNAGTGTPEEAYDWIRHVKSKSKRPSTYWEVGNELYMKGDQESSMAIAIPPDQYADRFIKFAKKMREASQDIKIGAIGGQEYGNIQFISYPDWNEKLLSKAGRDMDFLAVHNGYAPVLIEPNPKPLKVYQALLAAPLLIRKNLDLLDQQIEKYAGDKNGRVRVAVTEWGPIFQVMTDQPYYDHVKTLGSALFVASTFKSFVESRRTDIATFFSLCDYVNMGWIGRRDGVFIAKAPLYAFKMFTKHFGRIIIQSRVNSITYDSPSVGYVPAVKGVPYLESVASLSTDKKNLYMIVVNKHFTDDIEAEINISGFTAAANAEVWTLTGKGLDANTGTQLFEGAGIQWGKQTSVPPFNRIDKGGPGEITFESKTFSSAGSTFKYVFPKHSVTSIKLSMQTNINSTASATQGSIDNSVAVSNAAKRNSDSRVTSFFGQVSASEENPNKINTYGWEDSPYITPDDKKLYFMYTPSNFFPIFMSKGAPIVVGPDRFGHHSNQNPWDDSDIYESIHNPDGTWGVPVNLNLNTNGGECCMMTAQNDTVMYLQKTNLVGSSSGGDIFISRKNAAGQWSKPQSIGAPVNTKWSESNPHATQDEKSLYFMSDRPGSSFERDLYVSRKQPNGSWGEPINLGPKINSGKEDQIWVNDEETIMYFGRENSSEGTIFKSEFKNGEWTNPIPVKFGTDEPIGEISFSNNMKKAYFAVVDFNKKDIIMNYSELQPNGRWSKPKRLD